jgi:hypothetical protein
MRGSGSSKRLVHPFTPCLVLESLWDGRWRPGGHKKTAVLTALLDKFTQFELPGVAAGISCPKGITVPSRRENT